jgi:tetratricopeptide (TPR) repeat protein
MPPLINLLQPGKLHWLTVPRYAVIAIPLLLATGSSVIGQGGAVALTLLLGATFGCARLVWFKLLPHERARLDNARNALNAAQPDRAIGILLKPLALAGTHYQVKRAVLLARGYCRQGDLIKAHEFLSAHDTPYLLPDEQLSLQIAWTQLFIEADNPAEARRRLADISEQACPSNLNCLLLQAELALQDEHYPQARTLLESGLDRFKEPADRVLLHNNMARLEGLQGRKHAQLRHLQAARLEFKAAPRADLTDIVHHNLAIALVRNGQPEEAKEVLREPALFMRALAEWIVSPRCQHQPTGTALAA